MIAETDKFIEDKKSYICLISYGDMYLERTANIKQCIFRTVCGVNV